MVVIQSNISKSFSELFRLPSPSTRPSNLESLGTFVRKISETHSCLCTNVSSYKLFWGRALTSFIFRSGNPALLEVNIQRWAPGWGIVEWTFEVALNLSQHAPCFHPPLLRQEKLSLETASENGDLSSFANLQSTQAMSFPSWEQPLTILPPTCQLEEVFWGQMRELQTCSKQQIWMS